MLFQVRQFNRKDFERDQEFENERVRRLMGLDDEITAGKFEVLFIGFVTAYQ